MKINVTDKTKLQNAIDEAEGKANARTLSAGTVQGGAEKAEKRLDHLGIPKKHRTGCQVSFRPAQVANSYRSIAYGTYATIQRFPSGWFLVNVNRGATGSCSFGSWARQTLKLSDDARASIPDYEL